MTWPLPFADESEVFASYIDRMRCWCKAWEKGNVSDMHSEVLASRTHVAIGVLH